MPALHFSCPEDITSNPKTRDGFFCQSCSRNVIDFRNFSAEEMNNYFRNHQREACGIFHQNQILNPLQTITSTLFRFAFGLVFFLGMNSADLIAQDTTNTQQTEDVNAKYITVSGTVMDGMDSLPFVKITAFLKDDHKPLAFAVTDIDGKYNLHIPREYLGCDLQIEFRFIGYDKLRINITLQSKPEPVDAKLEFVELNITGIIVVGGFYQNHIPSDPYDFGKTIIRGEDLRNRQR